MMLALEHNKGPRFIDFKSKEGDMDKKKPSVGKTSPTEEQARLRAYGLDKYISKLPPMPEVDSDDVLVDESDDRFRDNIITVHPESLNELKLLVGIPNHHIDHSRHGVKLHSLRKEALPPAGRMTAASMSDDERETYQKAAYNLLMGHADEGSLDPTSKAVADSLLQSAQGLRVTVASDLVVQNGQTYTITTPSAVFNTITIYGTGAIAVTSPDVKVITNSLTYQP